MRSIILVYSHDVSTPIDLPSTFFFHLFVFFLINKEGFYFNKDIKINYFNKKFNLFYFILIKRVAGERAVAETEVLVSSARNRNPNDIAIVLLNPTKFNHRMYSIILVYSHGISTRTTLP